jgi:hypothetical protein
MSFSLPLAGKRCDLPIKKMLHREETAELKEQQQCPFHMAQDCYILKTNIAKLSFLVDSGATLSILPCSSSVTPLGANGANIPTCGFQKYTLAFGDKSFTHDFLLAKAATPTQK